MGLLSPPRATTPSVPGSPERSAPPGWHPPARSRTDAGFAGRGSHGRGGTGCLAGGCLGLHMRADPVCATAGRWIRIARVAWEGARAALSAGAAHAVYRVPHGGLPDLLLLLPAAAVYVAVDAVLAGEGRRRRRATSGRGFPGRLRLVLARLFGWPAAACALPALYLLQRAYHLQWPG